MTPITNNFLAPIRYHNLILWNKGGSSIDNKNAYWDIPLSAEQMEDLDPDLIKELNNEFDEVELPQCEQGGRRRSPVFKFIGLIIIVFFIAIFSGYYLQNNELPPLHILSQSGELKKTPEVESFQKAVVIINAIESKGTGFNIDSKGLIVTNAHVVANADTVLVQFSQGGIYQGRKLMSFPDVDLALIKINGGNLPKLDLAEDSAKAGSDVIIIGNPLGFPFVASSGTVAGTVFLNKWTEPVLSIEGYIDKGSSGSPVINSQGKVVGIIFAVLEASQDSGAEKVMGFAVPVESLKKRLKVVK
ncbi:MAG: S1C family serine protease [Bacillota bacterium]|jgi:serine protease Do